MPPPFGPLFLEGPPTSPAQASGLNRSLVDVEVFADFESVMASVRAATVGAAVGVALGAAVGVALGAALGAAVGATLGAALGATLGAAVGATLGAAVGATLGAALGAALGATLGAALRATLRAAAGAALGATVGVALGAARARYDRRRIVFHLLAVVRPVLPVCCGDFASEIAFGLRLAICFV